MSAEAPTTERPTDEDDPAHRPIVINSAPPPYDGRPWAGKLIPRPRRPRRKPGPKTPLPAGAAFAVWIMIVCSVVALWVLLFSFVLSGLQESRDQHELYGQLREELALATAPLGGAIDPGSPVAVVQIPALKVNDLVVVEGTAAGDLQSGPGHRRDTVLPGQHGTSIVYGRSVMFGAPFARVTTLHPGATIEVTTGQGDFTYVVDRVRRIGDPLPAPIGADSGRLMLVTSEGYGWQTGWAPNRTVYVDATLQGKTVPASPGRPLAIPAMEKAMQGDSGALVGLVLWLAALVLVVGAVVWGRVRWGQWQTWLVGVPVVLACAWGSTQLALQLLPNLV